MTGDAAFADYDCGNGDARKRLLAVAKEVDRGLQELEAWSEDRLTRMANGKVPPEVLALDPLRPRTANNLLLDSPPEPVAIVDKILLAATLLLIAGPPKVGKTWLALLLALCLVTGKPFLGFDVRERRRVLYLGGEGNDPHLKKRLTAAVAFFPGIEDADLDNLLTLCSLGRVKYDSAPGAAAITRWSDQADVLIFDPAFRFQSTGSENSHADARAVQDFLDGLKAAGKTLVVVHHVRKPGQIDSGISEIRGAGWDAYTDTSLILNRKKAEASERFILRFDLRHDEPIDEMELTREGPLFIPAEPTIRKATPSDVARFIQEAGGRVEGRQAIVEGVGRMTGAGATTVREAILWAEKEGVIFSAKRAGTRGQGRVYIIKEGGE